MIQIDIYQGNDLLLPDADINVIIDVVRAFTVSHYAFIQGAEEIILVPTIEDAFHLKRTYPESLLAGEINGLPIDRFDLDNSPVKIATSVLTGKKIIQKTTNGVKATLNSLNAKTVLVTGFSNANATIEYISQLCQKNSIKLINLIASHPSSDEDMACAEYIRSILLNGQNRTKETQRRVLNSTAVKKFLDPMIPEFDPLDIEYCIKPLAPEFIMLVSNKNIPIINKVIL